MSWYRTVEPILTVNNYITESNSDLLVDNCTVLSNVSAQTYLGLPQGTTAQAGVVKLATLMTESNTAASPAQVVAYALSNWVAQSTMVGLSNDLYQRQWLRSSNSLCTRSNVGIGNDRADFQLHVSGESAVKILRIGRAI